MEPRVKTTLSITAEFSAKVARAARATGQSKKRYLERLVEYIEKYGINPSLHESPRTELEQMRKRLDQVIGFQRTWEREQLKPAVAELLGMGVRLDQQYSKLVESVQKISENRKVQEAGYQKEVKEEKMRQTGVLEQLSEALNQLNSRLSGLEADVSLLKQKSEEKKKWL